MKKMTDRISAGGLQVAKVLYDFIDQEALPGTVLTSENYWSAFADIVHDMAPRYHVLMEIRNVLQGEIDSWHRRNRGKPFDADAYTQYLRDIGYLRTEGRDFTIATENVDPEIAILAGPQLVVPVMNARYALNAANARWGSLYDALYGTDVIDEDQGREKGSGYNPARGQAVFA